MRRLFDLDGGTFDPGYLNLKAGATRIEREIARALEEMWVRYEPYADGHFLSEFPLEPDARFWEMFLGCALLDAGKTLLRACDRPKGKGIGQPDICVIDGERRIWIEAIAPTCGDTDDKVPDIVPINDGGGLQPQPIRQVQLRITSALCTKSNVLARYIKGGIIRPEDVALIAIGGGRFGLHASGTGFPLALSAVFPIGDEFIRLNRDSLDVVQRGYHFSSGIPRNKKDDIARTAFLDEGLKHVSGLIWSRVGIGNMERGVRPLSLIHNPLATNPMPQCWGVWDREFVTTKSGEEWLAADILAEAKSEHRTPA